MSTVAAAAVRPNKGLHFSLWGVQVLLGATFLMAGITKSTQPMEVLAAQMPWTTVMGTAMTRFIGISELLRIPAIPITDSGACRSPG